MNAELKNAMEAYTTEIAEDYRNFVKHEYDMMVKDLGPALNGAYNSRRWANSIRAIGIVLDRIRRPGDDFRNVPATINNEKLEKAANEYGNRISLMWYEKTVAKLGDITNVTVNKPNAGHMIITGILDDKKVIMRQTRIINVSCRGMMFHQFPARISVDGKFYSESNYKKIFLSK